MQVDKCYETHKEDKQMVQEASLRTVAAQKAHKAANKGISTRQSSLEDVIRVKKAAEKDRCSAEACHKVLPLSSLPHLVACATHTLIA